MYSGAPKRLCSNEQIYIAKQKAREKLKMSVEHFHLSKILVVFQLIYIV